MTDDGAKEWVTVKVPKADKQQADEYRPEGSTFGDCLVAGAERLNDHLDSDTARFDDGVDTDELARQLAVALGDDYTAVAGAPQADDSEIASAVVRQFDYAELANRVADELEGRMR